MENDVCQCGDIREGSIYHGNFMNWWLECPRCHKQQVLDPKKLYFSKINDPEKFVDDEQK